MRIEAGTYCGAADGEIVESLERLAQTLDVPVKQRYPAGHFLADGERGSVLQVGAADFDQVAKGMRFLVQGVAQRLNGGDEVALDLLRGSDVHGGGERVVRGLRHVDVIVGMNGLLAPHVAAGELNGAVGDDLVG